MSSCVLGWASGKREVDLVEGDKKGAELHLPDICGWMAGCSPLLSSCAWMVSTTRLKRLLGPDGGRLFRLFRVNQINFKPQIISPQRQQVVLQQQEPVHSFQR